ncbi:MAG: hypothetical protein K0U78_00195 [Actinomycetia bacterium]|nr:hypothetical protein [Actinomycetes bacterium]
MSKVKIQGNASGTGVVTLTAPNTNTDRTITLPDDTQTLIGTNASGNVGIGTSSPNVKLQTSDASGVSTLAIDDSRGNVGDTDVIDFRHKGITGSQIKSEAIEDFSVSANRTSDLQFYTRNNGTISERLRIQSGGGISFNGDTAAANALDDYETGTFTAGFTGTTDTTTGYYTKVGRLVHFAVYGTGLNVTSATSARLTGLPFTCVDKYNAVPFTHGTYTSNCSGGYVNQGSNTVQLIQNNSTNAAVSSVGTRHGMIAGVYMA